MTRRVWRDSVAGWMTATAVLVGAGCGDDATPGGSDAADTFGADAADTNTTADTNTESDTSSDPEGTRYPIATTVGFKAGNFETNAAAAFDGNVDQTAAQSAQTPIFENIEELPLLFKEFDCELRLRRLEVHPPSDSSLLYHATNYPQGGTGKVNIVGRYADNTFWYTVATKSYAATGSVVFLPEDINTANEYVAYGVTFTSDEPLAGTLQVAEVSLYGYCAGPTQAIAWSTTPWLCTGVECVAASNPGGKQTRTVTCARDSGGTALESMCSGEKPVAEGESCALACGYTLEYVGMKPFTYDNGSGWLHEGNAERRAGPLPSDVNFGKTVAEIEGKPCSIETTNPATYFLGISCTVEGDTTNYCAFRCK